MSPSQNHDDLPHTPASRADGQRASAAHRAAIRAALPATIPVFLGYVTIGMAFGLLLASSGLPLWAAPAMSVFVYAGAAQFMGVGLLASGAGFAEIFIATFLLNLRHMVYGLSFLELYSQAGKLKPYMVFTLTDETYALLSTVSVPEGVDASRFRFWVSALDQSYWFLGTVLGTLVGGLAAFDTKGLDFSLTALFTVLLIEQIKKVRDPAPYLAAGGCTILSFLIFGPARMLLPAIGAAFVLLFLMRGRLERNG
jgi:4-azaleucine resistance transporter AzlC